MTAKPGDVRIVRLSTPPPMRRAPSTGGGTIYAIGDVHGRYDLLTALLGAIVGDLDVLELGAPPLLVFCGDYVDRGPNSAQVIDTLVWLSRRAPLEVGFLLGNHEAMLLEFLRWPERSLPWLQRDGESTLHAYGVAPVASDWELECRRLRDELMDRMPAAHLEFLRGLPTRLTRGDYTFVHAGLRPGVALARQADDDCLWIGAEFLEKDYKFETIVVHGHSWDSHLPTLTPNRIGIDTGAYSTGVLTAVRLDGPNVEFIQARSETGRPELTTGQSD